MMPTIEDFEITPCTGADVARLELLSPRRGCDVRFARQEAGSSTLLLARWQAQVVGRVEVMWTGPRMPSVQLAHPDVPEINGLDVLPHARGRGVGSALVRVAEDFARARGRAAIGMGVGLDNQEAERLYRGLGFHGDLAYVDTYVWTDESGGHHDAADPCRFLTKALV